MSSNQLPNQQKLVESQELAINYLEKEVMLMRDILANMHEEQQAILNRDDSSMQDLMSRRKTFYLQLTDIRNHRIEAMEMLALLLLHKKNVDLLFDENVGLEILLTASGVDSVEILSLREQMVALVEKMNQQICRNHDLLKHHISYFPDVKNFYSQIPPSNNKSKLLLTDELNPN